MRLEGTRDVPQILPSGRVWKDVFPHHRHGFLNVRRTKQAIDPQALAAQARNLHQGTSIFNNAA